MRRFSKRTSWPATLVAPPRFESTRGSSANDLSLTMTAIKYNFTHSKLAHQIIGKKLYRYSAGIQPQNTSNPWYSP